MSNEMTLLASYWFVCVNEHKQYTNCTIHNTTIQTSSNIAVVVSKRKMKKKKNMCNSLSAINACHHTSHFHYERTETWVVRKSVRAERQTHTHSQTHINTAKRNKHILCKRKISILYFVVKTFIIITIIMLHS